MGYPRGRPKGNFGHPLPHGPPGDFPNAAGNIHLGAAALCTMPLGGGRKATAGKDVREIR